MSVCISSNNNMMMTTSAEINDTNSVSTPGSTKAGIPAIPKRPTIIRVDKQNVQENTDESKSRGVPKVPPRPPPPRPGPPPVPSKQPVVQKAEDGKRKKKPEITVVSARPMSEVCFRDKKPEIPVPPRPQRLKDPGEVSSTTSIHCSSVALSTECSNQTRHSTTVVRSKSSTLPPQRPRLPPSIVAKKDPPKIPPKRPVPLKSTSPASVEPSPPPRPPACIQRESLQPLPDPTDLSFSPQEKPAQFTSFGKTVIPPKPRPRTFIDTSSKPPKPVIVQRSASAYKPTKDGIAPQPLPRKHGSFSCASVLETSPVEEPVAPPKPSRHQSFRKSSPPIPPTSSSPPPETQETPSESVPAARPLSPVTVPITNGEVLEGIPSVTEGAAPADNKTDPPSSLESTEIPESFNLEIETSSTDKTETDPLPHENSLVISQTSLERTSSSSSVDDAPVPCPRSKRSSKPDTPASTPVDPEPAPIASDSADPAPVVSDQPAAVDQDPAPVSSETPAATPVDQDQDPVPVASDAPVSAPVDPDPAAAAGDAPASEAADPDPADSVASDAAVSAPVDQDPVTIVSEEPKDFIVPPRTEILDPSAATVNKPTIIRVSNFIESPPELGPEQTLASAVLDPDSAEKQASSEKPPADAEAAAAAPKKPEAKKSRVPPPIPKKNPISANICDRNVPNVNGAKTVFEPPIPKKPPKPCPPAVAPMPVKNKPKEPEAKLDGGGSSSGSSSNSSSSSNLIKNLIFSKKSGSPSSSSTDLKKPSSVKSRKAADMLQSTKDYTRRITQSLGLSAAGEPTTVWYTDKSDEPVEEKTSVSKKKENPSIWYVDAVPDEETVTKKAPVPPKPAPPADKLKKPPPIPKDRPQKPKEMDTFCQPTEEPSPTEISAFQKYHSYMKRTIEEAVGIQLRQSSSSLIDEDLNEEKKQQGPDVMKPQPVPERPKSKKPIPPKIESRPPKPSVPPQVKPTVPAVPPKRPPVPASLKPQGPAIRPPPRRPKPIVSVKPTVPETQTVTKDSDPSPKSLIKSEDRTPSIENLIGKFEEEICKKNMPPPRPAQPVSKFKTTTTTTTTNILTDNKEQQLLSQNKETVPSADTKTETTSTPSNITSDSKIQPDENENLSVSAAEVGENTAVTETSLTTDSSIDENANEEATSDEPEKLPEANTVENVVSTTEESSVTETKTNQSHKVGYSDSFNQRCKSLMNDLKTHFDNDKDGAEDQIKEVVETVGESPDQLDGNPEKMQESSSNEEAEEKELNEQAEPPSSEEKSSEQPALEPDTTELSEKPSQEEPTSEHDVKVELDTKSIETSQEVSTLVIEEDTTKDAAQDLEEPPKSSNTSELTGPRAIANFDFDANEQDELTLKTPSDANGNFLFTDVSQESKMEDDATKVLDVDSQGNSTQVMDDAYQSLSEVRTGPAATASTTETEGGEISTKDETSDEAADAKDEAEEDELTDSDKLDKIDIPVGGEQTVAYALYDFDGEDGELSFKEGDAITILKWINEDWLLGKKEGLVGNLPANFVNFTGQCTDEVGLVDLEGPAEPKEPPPPLQADVKTDQLLTYVAAQLEHVKRLKGFACARFDFVARIDDELSFKDGDRIEILEFVNEDWIRGSLHKREGIFPAAFVSVEEYSPDEENCTSKATAVRALHDFTASADDELSFKAGALISCYGEISLCPGWSKGSLDGRTGMFPTEFVTQEDV